MNKITYLFGAGASVNALPIVNQIPKRLKSLVERLKKFNAELHYPPQHNESIVKAIKETLVEIIFDLEWIALESAKHASIDTFAKKLYLTKNHKDLRRLKIIMAVFFNYEQSLNGVDMRYDTFFASIIDNIQKLPENIKILSWNYDVQFERAFSEYLKNPSLSDCNTYLNIATNKTKNQIRDGFGIFKINGSTGISSENGMIEDYFIDNFAFHQDLNIAHRITASYNHSLKSSSSPTLSFAWENEADGHNFIELIKEKTADTQVLVVIGYSFPYFNRTIDRSIIKNMKNLDRVYLQSPEANNLAERFEAINGDFSIEKIKKISDVNQFLLPNEL